MASTTTASRQFAQRTPGRAAMRPNAVGLLLVILLAPVVALVSSSAQFVTIGAVAAIIAVLLVVLWSAELTFYILILSMLLSPELVVGALATESGANASRGITVRLDDLLIGVIALAWFVRLSVYKEAALLRRTPLNAPIFAYLAFSAVTTLMGAFVGRLPLMTGFFFVLKYFEYTVIYFLVVNYVRDREQVRRLLMTALVTALIIAVIAIAQIPSGARVTAPFEGESGEPNTLGGYLVLMLALSLAMMGTARSGLEWVRWLVMAGALTLPLAYTFSRTSWLAFCVMLFATIVLSRDRTIFFLLIAMVAVVLVVSPPAALIERAAYTLSSQRASIVVFGYTIEPSAAARLQAWILAGEALSLYPIAGAGVTGWGLIDAQYPRVLAETGVVGFGIFIWLMWKLGEIGIELRARARTRIDTVLANGYLAGFCGMLMHGIGANTFIIVRIMEPFWLVVGLVVASLMILDADRERGGDPAALAATT